MLIMGEQDGKRLRQKSNSGIYNVMLKGIDGTNIFMQRRSIYYREPLDYDVTAAA